MYAARFTLTMLAVLCSASASRADDPATRPASVTIRVVDEAGGPVPGARLALRRARYADGDEAGGPAFVNRWVDAMIDGERHDDGPTTDADGRVAESRAKLVAAAYGGPLTLWAVHEPTGRVGITAVEVDELPDVVTVTLRPGVKLSARMDSPSLRATGRGPFNYRVYVFTPDDETLVVDDRNEPLFEVVLPPGDYQLLLHIGGTYADTRDVILRAAGPVHVEADLAAKRIYSLIGRPAPAFVGITEW